MHAGWAFASPSAKTEKTAMFTLVIEFGHSNILEKGQSEAVLGMIG